ncbi:MAG TPA: serine/threonine-protein kinase [Nocardioidaceae bacterium]|nr:serine/threonine-protein kinase [Nocardioidaceae bacterium]
MDGIADYVFVRQLGEGNHGWFYLAERPPRLPVEDDLVVVKVLAGDASTEKFQRAVRELRAFAAVQSPYLVQLYDAGQDGGTVYYAMRYHPLGSLEEPAVDLTREGRLRAVNHAALAAHSLHEAGIVHRDIKPANILIDEDGARLSDLGLAQYLHPGITVSALGSLRSLEYVDPSVLRGNRVSRVSDVWSLGVTLHYALTGRGLYLDLPDADPLLALRAVIKQVQSPPLLDERLTEEEREVVMRAVAPDPATRYPTAADFAEAVSDLTAVTRA